MEKAENTMYSQNRGELTWNKQGTFKRNKSCTWYVLRNKILSYKCNFRPLSYFSSFDLILHPTGEIHFSASG